MWKIMGTTVRFVLLLAVLGSAGGMVWWWVQFRKGQPQVHVVDVGDLLSGVTVSGTVRNKEKTSVAAEIVAAVRRIAVTEGQRVDKGDVLIELDDAIVAAALAKALAQVDLAEQYLAEKKAGPRKEEIDKARASVAEADGELDHAKTNFGKVERLVGRGGATQSELSVARKKLKVAQAKVRAAKAQLDLLLAGTRKEEIARCHAEVRLAQAEVERCRAQLGKYSLRAPHRGVVTAKRIHVGEVVSPGEVLIHMNNIDQTEIRAQVQETQLRGIQPGHEARVLADAYPQHPLPAVVDQILPRVDPESGTVTVLLRLKAAADVMLMDGMAADIALIRERKGQVIRVPADSVVKDGEDAVVWVRRGVDFVRRSIEVGASDGQWVEVKSGLLAGEVVRVH